MLIENEEENRKMEPDPNTATLDHSVAFYDPQRSHNEAILLTPPSPQGRVLKFISKKIFARRGASHLNSCNLI